ncbi:MAG: signal peptidase II [Actinomycetota bacterium]
MQETRRAGALSLYVALLITATVIVVVDQLTKSFALANLADGPIDVIEGVLTLRLTYNPGGAFGVLQGVPNFFLIATVVIVVFILYWARTVESAGWAIPLGLVLGGGLGNLFDRIFRDTGGQVIDFVDLQVWPVFNVADSAITIGVLALLVMSFRAERRTDDTDDRGDRGR